MFKSFIVASVWELGSIGFSIIRTKATFYMVKKNKFFLSPFLKCSSSKRNGLLRSTVNISVDMVDRIRLKIVGTNMWKNYVRTILPIYWNIMLGLSRGLGRSL